MANPLDRYRKSPEEKQPEEDKLYTAYGVVSPQPRRLSIRRVKEAHRAPGYGYLIDAMWDGDKGREIALIYSHAVVMVKGRNLYDLAQQLVMEKIGWIQEFDPQRWPKPDPDQPVIDSIEYTTRVTSFDEGKQAKTATTGK
jgi:hypothetical protein